MGDDGARANDLVLALNRTATLITYDMESSVHRAHHNSWAGYKILYVLWIAGPLTSKNLANIAGMSRASVSNLSTPLTKRGLIDRRVSTGDARERIVHLTDAGREFIESVFVEQNDLERRWMSALTDVEQNLLAALLTKLLDSEQGDIAVNRRRH